MEEQQQDLNSGLNFTEETELRLQNRLLRAERDLAWARERNTDLVREMRAAIKTKDYALQVLSLFAPPDLTELLDDQLLREWLDA